MKNNYVQFKLSLEREETFLDQNTTASLLDVKAVLVSERNRDVDAVPRSSVV